MKNTVGILKTKILRILILMMFFCAVPAAGARAEKLNTTRGEVLTGGTWLNSGSAWRYQKSDGEYAANGFKKIDGYWYFFKKNGKLAKGLKKLKGKYYYFNPTGGAGTVGRMKTGLVTIKGTQYYFRHKGRVGVRGSRVQSGWRKVKGTKYYFKADGTLGTSYQSDDQFIRTVGKLAKADMKKTGILASVTIAQAILESGYGRSELALEANNLFGMKADLSGNTWESSWGGGTYVKKTQEYLNGRYVTVKAAFRAYPTIAASVRDHSDYLAHAMNGSELRYKGVVGNKSPRKTIKIIKKGGYATAPTYVSAVMGIIKNYKLTKYDK